MSAVNSCMRPVRTLATALVFLGFFVGTAGLGYVVLPLVRLRHASPRARELRCREVVASAFRFFLAAMRYLQLLQCDLSAVTPLHTQGAAVIVANHPTLIDVCALLAVAPEARCVVKAKLFLLPAVGPLLRQCGHLPTATDPAAAGRVLAACIGALEAGDSLLIFPEGTRSPEGALGSFHRGAFEIACRADVAVIAVLLRCDPPVLAKSAPWYRTPAVVPRLAAAPAGVFVPATYGGSGRAMAKTVESVYRHALALDGAPLEGG